MIQSLKTFIRTVRTQRFAHDDNGKLALAQIPNIPLLIWILLTGIAFFVKAPHAHTSLGNVADLFLFAWAYLEIKEGLCQFRRLLGLVVLIMLVVNYL
jgi:hypothetical protein